MRTNQTFQRRLIISSTFGPIISPSSTFLDTNTNTDKDINSSTKTLTDTSTNLQCQCHYILEVKFLTSTLYVFVFVFLISLRASLIKFSLNNSQSPHQLFLSFIFSLAGDRALNHSAAPIREQV